LPNPAVWTFLLCDQSGNSLGELTTASGKQLVFTRNAAAEVTFSISYEDDAAFALMDCIKNSGWPRLKCYRRGPNDTSAVLRFYGQMAPLQGELEETALMNLTFRGPFAQLVGDGENRGRFTDDVIGVTSANIGLIAQSLVETYAGNRDTGTIIPASAFPTIPTKGEPVGILNALAVALPAGLPSQQITYKYHNIGEAIQDLSALLDGFDFELVPTDSQAYPTPVLANASFDVDTTGWTLTGAPAFTRDTSSFNSSPAAGKVVASGASQGIVGTFSGTFLAGITYTVSFAYKNAAGGGVDIEFGIFNGADSVAVTPGASAGFSTMTLSWKPHADTTIGAFSATSLSAQTFWIDDVTVLPVPELTNLAPMANLVLYHSQGSDQPAAKFEYGPDTLSNVSSVSVEIEAPMNHVRVLGDGIVSDVSDPASIAKYGEWMVQDSQTDVQAQATLDQKANGKLRADPIKTLSFVPELGLDNCPKPWDSFWLGDTVHFYGRRGAFEEQATVRINGITVVVSDDGYETAGTPDPTTPGQDQMLRASLAIEATGDS
jgi:hypothetical protein